jgi:hypothetical protein
MNPAIFDSAFFGYSNLPNLIEVNDQKLIPIKTLNVFQRGTHFVQYVCKVLKIDIHRPVKGLLCVGDQYAQVLEYIHLNYSDPSGRNTSQAILNAFGMIQ